MAYREVDIPADDCTLKGYIFGNEEADTVVVLFHGGPGSGAMPALEWTCLDGMGEKNLMLMYDQRGSGASRYDLIGKGISAQQVADDAHAVVSFVKEQFPGKRVCSWGSSFGSLVSLMLLREYPTDVERAILCAPALAPFTTALTPEGAAEIFGGYHTFLPTPLLQKMAGTGGGRQDALAFLSSPELADFLGSFEAPPRHFEAIFHLQAMHRWLPNTDLRDSIGSLQIPVLFLQGEDDPICRAEVLAETLQKIGPAKSIRCEVLAGHGHSVAEDAKAYTVPLFLEFLAEGQKEA